MEKSSNVQITNSEKVTSLTAPADNPGLIFYPDKTAPLTQDETVVAMEELNNPSFISLKFAKSDRCFSDPPIRGQEISLHSFVPAIGATPDKDGVFGMVKIRGTFSSEKDANERAEFLIRNADSYHTIYHSYVGKPFPLTVSSDYSQHVEEVDIKRKISETISQDVKKKRDKEKQEIDETKAREKLLLEESSPDFVSDPIDRYIELRVKKAQLIWTYAEHEKKKQEVKTSLIRTGEELRKMDGESDEYSQKFYDKYMKARIDSGFDDKIANDDSFMRYLNENLELDFEY